MVDAVPRPPDAPVSRTVRLTRARGRRGAGGARPGGAAGCTELDTVRDAVLRNAPVPLANGDAELEAGEVRSQAAVDPPAEAEVAVDVTLELDDVCSFVDTLVRVRGADQAHDLVACLEGAATQFDVLGDDARDEGDRGFEAQELLDCRWEYRRVFHDAAAELGLPSKPGVEARETVGDGIESGHDHELADAEELLFAQGLASIWALTRCVRRSSRGTRRRSAMSRRNRSFARSLASSRNSLIPGHGGSRASAAGRSRAHRTAGP